MGNHKRTIQEKREDAANINIVEDAFEELTTDNKELDRKYRDNVKNYYEYVDREPRI